MRRAQSGQLLNLLQRNEILKSKGFSLAATNGGGIAIDRWGHVHGIWDCDGQYFTWTSLGSSKPTFRTDNPSSAVVYTLVTLSQA